MRLGARDRWIAAICLLSSVLLCPNEALGAGHGTNGRIAFASQGIYTVNPDGSDLTTLFGPTATFDFVTGTRYSLDGRRIVFSYSRGGGDNRLVVLNATGPGQHVLPHKRFRGKGPDGFNDMAPTFSPDGRHVLFTRFSNDGKLWDLFEMDVTGRHLRRLTHSPAAELGAEFSPNARRIVFTRGVGTSSEVFTMSASGGEVRRLTSDTAGDQSPTFSPNGKEIVWSRSADDPYSLWVMSSNGSSPRRLTPAGYTGTDPEFSPDGSWIVYENHESAGLGKGVLIMPSNGGVPVDLTEPLRLDGHDPSWQPIPR
jgi:Tol biopolymer transport system component